uniref:Uncharacterized protein n=1 Tax=Lactuca sativa TaxID=4236 RepID=A0A9R1X6F6_LACSA|nr:hypothetical protein LSAT_V11C600325210 [Lactuca sativa]
MYRGSSFRDAHLYLLFTSGSLLRMRNLTKKKIEGIRSSPVLKENLWLGKFVFIDCFNGTHPLAYIDQGVLVSRIASLNLIQMNRLLAKNQLYMNFRLFFNFRSYLTKLVRPLDVVCAINTDDVMVQDVITEKNESSRFGKGCKAVGMHFMVRSGPGLMDVGTPDALEAQKPVGGFNIAQQGHDPSNNKLLFKINCEALEDHTKDLVCGSEGD